jgi:outer membrane protein assembly factor BamB
MSKQDEQFFPERVDGQIEALSYVEPEDTSSSSSARLVSNLHQVYEEDTEIVEQVWARLTERTAEKKRIMVGQENVRSSSLLAGRADPQKGPQQMKPLNAGRQGQQRRSRFLEPYVAVLILVVLVGSTALLLQARQSSQTTGKSSTPTEVSKKTTPLVGDQTGLYISTQDELARLNLQTGKTIWQIKAAYPLPVVMGGIVVFGGQDSTQPAASSFIEAVHAASGQPLWRKNYWMVSYLQGANGIVFASLCNQLFPCSISALKASDGARLWSYNTPSGTAWIKVQDGVVYGISYTQFFALNAKTGTPIWQKALHYPGQQANTAPQVINDVLYFASCDTRATSTTVDCYLYAFDASNGGELWHTHVNGLILASLTAADGRVYAGSREGLLYTLNDRTGSLLWTYNAGGHMIKSLLATPGVLYAETVNESGSAARLLALNVATRSAIWSKDLAAIFGLGPDWQTLALANGLIYTVDGKQNVSVFHADDGRAAKSYRIAVSSPIVEFSVVLQNAQ